MHLRRLSRGENVGATGDGLVAAAAVPDADDRTLHRVLPAEDARVLGVLAHLHLLNLLTQRRSVPHAVLSGDSSLLGALRGGETAGGRHASVSCGPEARRDRRGAQGGARTLWTMSLVLLRRKEGLTCGGSGRERGAWSVSTEDAPEPTQAAALRAREPRTSEGGARRGEEGSARWWLRGDVDGKTCRKRQVGLCRQGQSLAQIFGFLPFSPPLPPGVLQGLGVVPPCSQRNHSQGTVTHIVPD